MVSDGCPAGPASSCPCACCRGCSAASSSSNSWPRTELDACNSSARTPPSRRGRRSRLFLHRYARPNGSSTPSAPLAGQRRGWPICPRYTHRVAISNSRLIALNETSVTFKWKDYRIDGNDRYKTMTLAAHEFIRRFLIHVLPSGFHRIRHYGLFASGVRAHNIAHARELLAAPAPQKELAPANDDNKAELTSPSRSCPCCGGRMIVIETFERGRAPRGFSMNDLWIDTS